MRSAGTPSAAASLSTLQHRHPSAKAFPSLPADPNSVSCSRSRPIESAPPTTGHRRTDFETQQQFQSQNRTVPTEYGASQPNPSASACMPPPPQGHTEPAAAAAYPRTSASAPAVARSVRSCALALKRHRRKHTATIFRNPHFALTDVIHPSGDRQLLTRHRARDRRVRPQMLHLQQHILLCQPPKPLFL